MLRFEIIMAAACLASCCSLAVLGQEPEPPRLIDHEALEEFGLSADAVRSRLADYIARFDLPAS